MEEYPKILYVRRCGDDEGEELIADEDVMMVSWPKEPHNVVAVYEFKELKKVRTEVYIEDVF